MRRLYLKVGDKSSAGGTVIEGVPSATHHGTALTFVGAQVICPACRITGHIGQKGPRWPGRIMGKDPALEGDICMCRCDPHPVMIASQDTMSQSFDSHALASMGYGLGNDALAEVAPGAHWIRFAVKDAGSCEGLRCRAYFADGSVADGVFDSGNTAHFDRPNASPCHRVEVVPGNAQESARSVMGDLLMAMVG
ncbi:PAAR motif-containing protein [Paraburkholderia sp. BL6669N2]|uniref:PAAR domain-containing protein n=1 Tax=unclassified Paraburkholderia TaxID=2615204 RepID=UPI000E222680|nr:MULTISPECIES: PAAR domain-containing protein [unclassified Paraburkholderia]REE18916.1 PAAR motif-containing protein [Paraburkholderia sp. BL27I4N3]REG58004.1 PAAR motif-containing protein [Paraburkholderia sp. BL6669N2]